MRAIPGIPPGTPEREAYDRMRDLIPVFPSTAAILEYLRDRRDEIDSVRLALLDGALDGIDEYVEAVLSA